MNDLTLEELKLLENMASVWISASDDRLKQQVKAIDCKIKQAIADLEFEAARKPLNF